MEPFDTSNQTLIIGIDYGMTCKYHSQCLKSQLLTTVGSGVCFISVPAEPEVHRTEIWDHRRGRILQLYCAEGEKGDNFVDTYFTEASPPMGQSLLYCGSRNGNQAFQMVWSAFSPPFARRLNFFARQYKKTQETIAQCFRCSWRGTIQLQEEDLGPFHTWLSWNLSQGNFATYYCQLVLSR